MANYGFRNRILELRESGAALANSTTQTSLLPGSAKEAFVGAGQLRLPSAIAFLFSGRISTLTAAPGTLALAIRIGSVDVFSSGAMPLNVTAQTNVHWCLSGELVAQATGVGTSTTFFPKGCVWTSYAVIGSPAPSAGSAGELMLPHNAAPAVGSGIDFSASNLIDLMATWSVASASNSIQVHTGHLEQLLVA